MLFWGADALKNMWISSHTGQQRSSGWFVGSHWASVEGSPPEFRQSAAGAQVCWPAEGIGAVMTLLCGGLPENKQDTHSV